MLSQVDQLMANKTELVRRTQLMRTPVSIIGHEAIQESGDEPAGEAVPLAAAQQYIAEIFDDSDFYENLLRDLSKPPCAAVAGYLGFLPHLYLPHFCLYLQRGLELILTILTGFVPLHWLLLV